MEIFGISAEHMGTGIGIVSGICGILAFFPTLLTTYTVVFGKSRAKREIFRQLSKKPGTRPSLLIVDFLPGKEISAAVERFRQGNEVLKAIPQNRMFKMERSKSLKSDDMPGITSDLRSMAADIMSHGTDVLHLFYGGPGGAAMVVGAEFANSCRVILYQHEHGDYENWGVLKHDYTV